MNSNTEPQVGVIMEINGDNAFKAFLLAHNITKGTTFHINYSPNYAQLINLTVGNKMLSLRKHEFLKIDWIRLK